MCYPALSEINEWKMEKIVCYININNEVNAEREHEVEGRRCLFSLVWMHSGSELVHYMFNFKQKRNFFEFVKCLQQLYS